MERMLSGHKVPKVSVIIPIYNSEKYLSECLTSIINQTLKEIEVILIDDESTDNSLSICREFANKDKRICVHTQKNIGPGLTRNKGINLAKGDYVVFIDPDDYYCTNNALELLYLAATLNNVNICAGGFSKPVVDDGIYQNFQCANDDYLFKKDGVISYKDWQFSYGFHCFIYKRDFLIQNKLYFPDYQHFEDHVFFVQTLYKAKYFYAINRPIYAYRTGCEKIYWTKKKLSDFLSGVFDNICFAQKHNLKKLFRLSYVYLKEIFDSMDLLYPLDKDLYNTLRYLKRLNPFFSLFDDVLKTPPPKVSVIVPVYNVERYLDEALQSVTKQTLRDIEIICINDGSTDSSLKILHSYQKKDNRIKIIDKPNTGYGDSMNIGVQSARGEYIGIVEPDDYILEGMYEYLYKKAKEFDLDYIKSDYYEFFDADREKEKIYKSVVHNVLQDYNRVINPQEEMYTVCTTDVHTWAGLYKREFLLDNKIVYSTTPGASFQDSGFFFKTMCCAKRIMFVRRPFYMYRIDNPTQSIKGNKFKIFHEHLLNKDWLESFSSELKYLYAWGYRFIRSCFWIIDTSKGSDRKRIKGEVKRIFKDVFGEERLKRVIFSEKHRINFTRKQWERIEDLLSNDPPKLKIFFSGCWKCLKRIFGCLFSLESDKERKNRQITQAFDKERKDKQIIRILGFPLSMDRMRFYSWRYRKLEPKVVFSNFFGNGYGCNPKYIAEEIIKRKLPYKLVWLLRDGVEGNLPSNIVPVRMGTPEAYKELVTATVWVDNQRKHQLLQEGIYKRKGQCYIQTWHGSLGIKKLDNDMAIRAPKWLIDLVQRDSRMTDYLLTNSEFENGFIGKAMWFDNEIKPFGHPRNDIFFKSETEQTNIRRKVCKILSVNPDSKIILYAPSWRDNYVYGWAMLDFERLLSAFQKKWHGQDYSLLIRLHPFHKKGISESFYFRNDKIIDASEYPDIQELLLIADYMISDYSSCLFDYVITHKPGFIFAPDRQRYENTRGFYYPLEDTPFPIAKNNYEMEQNILNFNMEEYQRKVDSFLKSKGCFEDGHASERVVDLIESVMKKNNKNALNVRK